MNVEWPRHDYRLDVEVAVALELGARHLVQARSPRQLEAAIIFNLRLWKAVRGLADRCHRLADREPVRETGDHVAMMLVDAVAPDSRDLSFVAGRNLSLARDLAGEAATARTRDALIAEWSGTGGGAFEDWLVARLTAAGCR